MADADKPLASPGQFSADIVVIGGGIAGCWAALKALRAGLSVILVEKHHVGAGASSGFLGALMPHMPERWDDKKAFQFAALVDLEAEVGRLEDETGIDTGYGRVGRIMPLSSGRQLTTAQSRGQASGISWGRNYAHRVLEAESWPHWLDPATAPQGVAHDTLSARVSPQDLLAALIRACSGFAGFGLMEGRECAKVDEAQSRVLLADGAAVSFGNLLLCNGLEAFGLIEDICGSLAGPLGNAVKGQAALFEAASLPAPAARLPVIYENGVYVIAHASGRIAVGSTSETGFADPFGTDEKLDQVLDQARRLCPVLRQARLTTRWAGLRPRPAGRDPMLGHLPERHNVYAITGGYKISFGIAHRMADAVISRIIGESGPEIPPSFLPAHHLREAADRGLEKRS